MAVYKSKITAKDGRQYFFKIKYKDILGVTHDYASQKYKTLKDATNEKTIYKLQVMQKNISTSALTINQIWEEYYLWKSDKIKRQTLNKIVVQYNKYIKPLGNIKINDFNIKHYQFLKKEILYFTYEEYLKFIDKVEKFDYKVFYQVLYFLGLRQGECLALNWKDINFDKKTLRVCKTLTSKIKGESYTISSPKTKSSCRVLPIPNGVLESLKTLYNDAKSTQILVMTGLCLEIAYHLEKQQFKLTKIKHVNLRMLSK